MTQSADLIQTHSAGSTFFERRWWVHITLTSFRLEQIPSFFSQLMSAEKCVTNSVLQDLVNCTKKVIYLPWSGLNFSCWGVQ